MEFTMSDAFKACTTEWSCMDFMKQQELVNLVEKLKERAAHLVTNKAFHKLQMAEADALAAQERHFQASFVRTACRDMNYSCDFTKDEQHGIEDDAWKFHKQFKDLHDMVLIAESSLASCLCPPSQPEVAQEFMAEIHDLVKKQLRKCKSKLLKQMGELSCSDVQESVLSSCIHCDVMKTSIFNLRCQYTECVSEFMEVSEEYHTAALSMPLLDEKEHKLLTFYDMVYEEYFLADNDLDEEVEPYRDPYLFQLFRDAQNRLVHDIDRKRVSVQERKSRLQGFEHIWSTELEDLISSYTYVIRDNKGLHIALDAASSDSDD